MRKAWLVLLSIVLILSLAACGGNNNETSNSNSAASNSGGNTAAADNSKNAGTSEKNEEVTLKFFTALADRSNGAGKIEQELIDAYTAANPHVKIEVEALQDEPYKQKVKVYSSTIQLPDIFQTWGQASFIKPLIDNNLLLELNSADFEGSGFVPGAADGFSKEGKMFGLPRSTDFLVIYYNKKIFSDNGAQVPQTIDELKSVIKTFRDKGINPIAINGMDLWALPIWFEYVQQRQSGDFNIMDKALNRSAKFTDASFLAAAQEMQEMAKMGAFADGYLTADYGAARNLFGQGQAAMYMMGNWESGLATDENFSEEFRNNVGAFPYPASANSKTTDTTAWFGGGYSIGKNTKHPEEAIAFLQYFFQPENWAKKLWENGAGTPASKFDMTGKETELLKELIAIFNNMTSSAGTPVLDESTPQWKETIMNLHAKLLGDQITPQQFVEQLDAAADKAAQQ